MLPLIIIIDLDRMNSRRTTYHSYEASLIIADIIRSGGTPHVRRA